MNWSRIEQLLASCEKQPPSRALVDMSLGDYADVLARYNGLEGFVGSEQYLQLWKAEDIVGLNAAYHVQDFVPGTNLIGTDGGDTGYGVEAATSQYVSVPLVGMSPDAVRSVGASFEEFLEKLAVE
jgi:hypothetical protein